MLKDKQTIAGRRRAALFDHLTNMNHRELVSFLSMWFTTREVKRLCEDFEIDVKSKNV